jgi:uncharacterized membrane protein (DUF4010 family)
LLPNTETPLTKHLRDTTFWFDLIVLTILWLLVLFVPKDLFLFNHSSLIDILKIVALIASLEVLGFFSCHLMGNRAGLLLQGFLGGFVSSTMTYLRFTKNEDLKDKHARTISRALILSTIAMLIEGVFIVVAINPFAKKVITPLIVQIVILVIAVFMIKRPVGTVTAQVTNTIEIAEPIIWKRVLYFSTLIISLIFLMRFISEKFSLPYQWTSFLVSLFESHAVLAAAMTEFQGSHQIRQAQQIVVLVLTGNVLSKTFFILKADNKAIRWPLLVSLYSSLLAAILSSLV